MTDWIQHVLRALGTRGLEPQAAPIAVAVIPDDYAPPERFRGIVAVAVGAGGVGTRSQVLYLAAGGQQQGTLIELERFWFSSAATLALEIVRPDATVTGYTDQAYRSTDLRAGIGSLRVQTKINAAADVGASLIAGTINYPTIDAWLDFPLHGLIELGGPATRSGIIIRPSADNTGLRVVMEYRELGVRKL